MEFERHIEKARVVFQDDPELSPREVHEKRNKQWQEIRPLVEKFLINHPRFSGKEVKVYHRNHSSYIVELETSTEKLVLKILTSSSQQSEPAFLRKWQEVGVAVPNVIETGMIGQHQYMMMEHVAAPLLKDVYNQKEMVDDGHYEEMGRTLRTMHKAEGEGWGNLKNGAAEYSTFDDYISSEEKNKKISYVKENGLLGDQHGSLDRAIEILKGYSKGKKTSYCHNDFGSHNIFATRPITVFDPNPELRIAIFDVGRTMLSLIAKGLYPEQFLEGYFGEEKPDKKVLHAAVLINAYIKFPNWNKLEKDEQMKNLQEYLKANKHLLEG